LPELVKKAVIPAAGLGTRFLPATKAQPKEMLPIVDKPTIQYVVEEAVEAGINEILIITGRNKRAIEDHFDHCLEIETALEEKGENAQLKMIRRISEMAEIHYVRQREPLGLGHAIYCARTFVGNEPFAVLLGDDIIDSSVPCIQQLLNLYEELGGGAILGVQHVAPADVHKYGIVNVEKTKDSVYKVKGLLEKPSSEDAHSNLAVLGRYIINPQVFQILEKTPPKTGGEIQLTDALNSLAQLQPVWALNFEGRRYDIGDKLGFLKATVEFALKRKDLGEDFKTYLLTLLKGETANSPHS
jgi:UTP--glucose-1-phosphate uridylyltransferase